MTQFYDIRVIDQTRGQKGRLQGKAPCCLKSSCSRTTSPNTFPLLHSQVSSCIETKLFWIFPLISLQQLMGPKGLAGKVICLPISRAIPGYGLDSLLDLTRPIQLACQVWGNSSSLKAVLSTNP